MKKKVFINIIILLFAGLSLHGQALVLDSIVSIPVSCGGGSDGTITVYISGGSGTGYNYNLRKGIDDLENSGLTMSTSYSFIGYEKSTSYYIIISDNNPSINPIFPFASIGGPDPIQITSAFTTDINCATFNDGTITVTATGENGNFDYALTGPVTDNNSVGYFDLLPTGTYQVTVTDTDGCPSTDVAAGLFIDIPPLLTVVVDAIQDATCFGGTDGFIDITAAGGNPIVPAPDYTYNWTGPGIVTPSLEDQANLFAGNYEVVVTDDKGCTVSSGTLTIGEAAEIIMSVTSSTDVTCNGGSDGKVNISRSGGAPPYSYSWDGQSTLHNSSKRNADDLIADIYDLTITDSKGCVKTFLSAVEISEPDPITVNIDNIVDVSCFGFSDGSAEITISGGTAPYLITSWTGPVASALEDPVNLLAGDYTLDVTDANGCTQNFPAILTIDEPEDITALLDGSTDVLCFGGNDGTAQVTVNNGTPGYSYLWSGDGTAHTSIMEDPTDLIADTYDLEITDANSCVKTFNDMVVIGQPDDITNTISVVDILCNSGLTGEISIDPLGGTTPYTFAWIGPDSYSSTLEDITGLKVGFYDLTITDAQSCTKDYSGIEVKENTSITGLFSITNLTCNASADGEIDATIGGGVGPYSFSWVSDLAYSNNIDEDITLLVAADYTLTVTDAVSCVQAFPAQTVTEPDPLVALFSPTDVTCFQADNGEIAIDVSGGTTPYVFSWTGPGVFTSNQEDITGLEPGDYSLLLSDDNACSVNYPNEVTISEPNDITATPTAIDISCNGYDDGSISIVVAEGTPGYTFIWSGPNGYTSTAQNISGLEPGIYDLRVTDAEGCIKDFFGLANLIEPSSIIVSFVSQVDLSCFGDNNGSIEIDIIGGVAPYTFDWTNSLGTTVSAVEDPSGLIADTYSLDVVDNSTCPVSYPDAIILTEPAELTITLSKTDVICYNESNGSIIVTATGGVRPFEYRRLGFAYQSDSVFTGLTAGTYTIYTRDFNLCETSELISVNQPGQITYSDYGVSGSNTCNGDADATIYVNTINGGVTPYEYTINGGSTWQLSNSFPNLPGGSYDFRVRDANLCERTINNNLLVDEPFPITIIFYEQDEVTTCFDTPEGRIALMGNGGTGNLEYSINGGTGQASGEFLNLLGGIYDVRIVDDSSCVKDTIVEILKPAKVVFDQANITNVTGCGGGSNGEIDVNAVGGTGLIQYSLNTIDYQVSGIFTGLIAGDTTVTAQDTKGCTADTTLTITEPDPIIITLEDTIAAACNGASTGSVIIEATGGTTPYTFTLNPALLPPQNNGTFNGLPTGDYTVDVNDAVGCGPISSNILRVNEPTAVVVDSIITDFISCNGANDAEILIFVSGGTPPYEYSVDNEATYLSTSTFTGLGTGIYDVFVKDANGCSLFANTYTFVDPVAISLTALLTHVTPCFGGTNGAISATATGGWESFEYSIDGATYLPSGDFSGLAAGDYTIFTVDTGSCTASIDVTINEPAEVTATIVKTDYAGAVLGTITISSPTGGTPPYDYSIDGLGGTFTSTTVYTDLIAGTYDVVVRDALACTFEQTIEIYDIIPLFMIIDSTDVSCNAADDGSIEFIPQNATGDVQYSIDDGSTYLTSSLFEDLPGNIKYYLRAFDEDGKVFYDSVFIDEPSAIVVNVVPTPANCNAFSETGAVNISITGGAGGYTTLWSNGAITEDLVNVVAGDYSVIVTDDSGCNITEPVFISSFIILNADAGIDTTICQGETIILYGKSGDVVLWEPATYLNNQGIADPVAENILETITYTYTETETSSPFGCYDIDSITINVLPTFGIDVTQDTVAIEGAEIQLEAIGGPFESYEWVPSTGLSASDIADPIATAITTIRYFIYATNEFGCVETDSVLLEVIEDITVYNAFSPNNGDDINQYFEIKNASQFPDIIVEVYNRWGSKIFSSVGYTDDKRWDGTSRGQDVPIGTYYYVIIPFPDAAPITGNVTIIR